MASVYLQSISSLQYLRQSINNEHMNKSYSIVIIWIGVLIGCSVLYFNNPVLAHFYPVCMFHHFTGLHCPGCGILRASYQLIHGNIISALGLNPLFVFLLPFFIWYGLSITFPKYIRQIPITAGMSWAIVYVIIGYSIMRNIPVYPFSILAP